MLNPIMSCISILFVTEQLNNNNNNQQIKILFINKSFFRIIDDLIKGKYNLLLTIILLFIIYKY